MTVDLESLHLDPLVTWAQICSQTAGDAGDWAQTAANAASVTGDGKEWTGQAADAWTTTTIDRMTQYDTVQTSLEQISSTLTGLHTTLDGCITRYKSAKSQVDALEGTRGLAPLLLGGVVRPGQTPEQLVTEDEQPYRTAMATAQADAEHAIAVAARTISGLAADAASVVPQPQAKGSDPVSASWGATAAFLDLVLNDPGAADVPQITANRIAGRAFQEEVARELGIDENFQAFEAELEGAGLTVTIPDGDTGDVFIEMKNVGSLSNSAQLRAMVRVASMTGRTPNIVVRANTKISAPLLRSIQAAGGRIVSRIGPNQYVERTTRLPGDEPSQQPMKFDPQNGFQPDDPGGASTDEGSVIQGPTAGGGDAVPGTFPGGAGDDDTPIEPIEPVEPIDPEDILGDLLP